MGDDQLRVGIGVGEAPEVVRDRRQAATAVDEDRDLSLGRQREHRRQPLVVQEEALGARMELDASRAEVEATLGLRDRILSEVEPDERDQPPLGALRVLECAVVRRSEGGVAVRLVHAEHEGAGDAVARHDPLELLVGPAPAVDVVAEVDVRVENLRADRKLLSKLLVVRGNQLLAAFERVVHEC